MGTHSKSPKWKPLPKGRRGVVLEVCSERWLWHDSGLRGISVALHDPASIDGQRYLFGISDEGEVVLWEALKRKSSVPCRVSGQGPDRECGIPIVYSAGKQCVKVDGWWVKAGRTSKKRGEEDG